LRAVNLNTPLISQFDLASTWTAGDVFDVEIVDYH